ncbi:MAG TPA: NTP transferase domain-containing protein [Caulobacteraceae bacterium]|jgi:molybdenum cofactor cytidylyltransferase|nr:NTP transferase domain-containing protein [Caulobacteraceae bacterium]
MSGYHAVVLAAGAGARFGGGKLMAPFRGGALVDRAVAAALAAPVETVVVVTGADDRLAVHLSRRDRLVLVRAADHAEGMAASLRAGLAALPAGAAGALVFLGDMPDTPAAVPPRLIAALAGGAPAAVPVFEGRRGHPAGFSSALFPELLRLRGDRGARDLLAGLGDRLAEIETSEPGVMVDVDTPQDMAKLI